MRLFLIRTVFICECTSNYVLDLFSCLSTFQFGRGLVVDAIILLTEVYDFYRNAL